MECLESVKLLQALNTEQKNQINETCNLMFIYQKLHYNSDMEIHEIVMYLEIFLHQLLSDGGKDQFTGTAKHNLH